MAGALPAFNPFPAQATTAIAEGSFVDSYRRWAKSTPTLDTTPVMRLRSLIARYRDSFNVHGESPDSRAVFVHGEHGSGKTHAIMSAVGDACVRSDGANPLPLYAKMSGADFLAAYRQLMAQISGDELTDIALRFLSSFNERGPLSDEGHKDLQRDPSLLFELFDKHLIERGLLLQAQADKVHRVVRDETNFQRALTYLLEPGLRDTAFRWILGLEVPASDLSRLGISRPINTLEQCRYGLQLLTLLCAGAKRPLILLLDQAEKFFIDTSGTLVAESLDVLHTLAEKVPEIGGMLIVAASEHAWDRLPVDLRQRFGTNDVACTALDTGDAIQFIGVYVLAALDQPERAEYRAPWPFTDAAIHKLLRVSGGNPRALLQLAWQAFDDLPIETKVIDEQQVQDGENNLDLDVVELVVRRALWRIGPVRPAEQDGFHFAVAVSEQTRLVVRVTKARFYLDESIRAEQDALARLMPRDGVEDHSDRYVLVIAGYASAKVLDLLSGLYDDVIVHRDEDSTEAAFERIAGTAQPGSRSTPNDIKSLVEAFSRLNQVRSVHEERLGRDIAELSAATLAAQATARFEDLIGRWQIEERSILDDIERQRQRRAEAELHELYRINRSAHLRDANFNLGLTTLLVAAAIPVGIYIVSQLTGSGLSVIVVALMTAIVAAASQSAATAVRSYLRSRVAPPGSLAEAERMARERAHKATSPTRSRRLEKAADKEVAFIRDVPLIPDLRSSDPYYRLGYILLTAQGLPRTQLVRALSGERVGMIRRVLADRLGKRLQHGKFKTTLPTVDTDLPELPYLIQHLRVERWNEVESVAAQVRLLLGMVSRLDDRDRAAAARDREAGWGRIDASMGGYRLRSGVDAEIELILRAREGVGALGAAYAQGIDYARFVRACGEVNDRQAKLMERLLSPHGGLGSHDHLELAPEIEQLYLFFCKLNYLREGGGLWS